MEETRQVEEADSLDSTPKAVEESSMSALHAATNSREPHVQDAALK